MLLDSDTLKHELELLDGWKTDDNSISRVIPMHNWKGVLMLTNAIAHLAEQAWHHPDLMLTFSSITIKLTIQYKKVKFCLVYLKIIIVKLF